MAAELKLKTHHSTPAVSLEACGLQLVASSWLFILSLISYTSYLAILINFAA